MKAKIFLCLFLLFAGLSVFIVGSPFRRRLLSQQIASTLSGKGEKRALEKFRERLEITGLNQEALQLSLLVQKAERLLFILADDRILATFPIALGHNPVGNKETLDDGRTPEGEYCVCYKKENSRYHLFIGLSYPSPADSSRALTAGRITATEAEAILDACMKRERPPWNTALGGPFGIHGFGTGEDWTEGTIAVSNSHIEELYYNIPMGTPVKIIP